MEWISFLPMLIALYIVFVCAIMQVCFGTALNIIHSINCCKRRRPIIRQQLEVNGINERELFVAREHQNECSICLMELSDNTVAAMCGHRYCAPCIMNYWMIKNKQQIKCPQCNRHVNFFAIFDENKVNSPAKEDLQDYNQIFSGDRNLLS